MFTDGPATPLRVETLVELLDTHPRGLTRDSIENLLQPDGLPGLEKQSNQARATLGAARDLEILEEDGGVVRLRARAGPRDRSRSARDILLAALDEKVLADLSVEPYFALFYSFLLGLDAGGTLQRNRDAWAAEFNRVVKRGEIGGNPFNATKVSGLRGWYGYTGLGWFYPSGVFHCNPYARLLRALPTIFAEDRVLGDDVFMAQLASVCPELDGGTIFRAANSDWDSDRRTCTLGLSHALVDLHFDGVLRLDCPVDAHGWSIAAAEPPRDGGTLRSDRIVSVEYVR